MNGWTVQRIEMPGAVIEEPESASWPVELLDLGGFIQANRFGSSALAYHRLPVDRNQEFELSDDQFHNHNWLALPAPYRQAALEEQWRQWEED